MAEDAYRRQLADLLMPRQSDAYQMPGQPAPWDRPGTSSPVTGTLSATPERPADWAVSSGIAETLSPTVQGFGAGQMSADAIDAYRAGNYGTAAGSGLLAAMSMMPGFKGKGAPVAAAAEAKPGIRAYHGSPHDFNAFSDHAIGSGEGAQAYGRGHYFAEAEPVAQSYRDGITWNKWTDNVKIDGTPFNEIPADLKQKVLHHFQGFASIDDALANQRNEVARAAKGEYPNVKGKPQQPAPWHQEEVDRLAWMEDIAKRIDVPKGHMYEVNINADPSHFLDWDKPISQQHEKVQKALRAIADAHQANPALGPRRGGKHIDQYRLETDAPASETMLSMGDTMGGQDKISNALREAGVPGVSYLDQGSRGAGTGTRNHVVFDPQTIEILRKYGLLPPAALVGGNALMDGGTEQ